MVSKITTLVLQTQGHQRSSGDARTPDGFFHDDSKRQHLESIRSDSIGTFVFTKCVFTKNDGAHLATSEMCSLVCLRGPGVFSGLWEH